MSLFERVRNVFRSGKLDDDLRAEMQFHLDARAEQYLREGLTEREARERARRDFGNPTAIVERSRDVDVAIWLEGLWQDVRYGARQLRRNPGFAGIAIASLTLGIGATAALFAVVDTVLLKPLPLPRAHELVSIQETRRGETRSGGPARLKDFRSARSLAAVTGFYSEGVTLRTSDGPIRLTALRTFGPISTFSAIQPALGRLFTQDEEIGNGAPVALISDKLWRERFSRSPAVLSQSIVAESRSCSIVGVLPASLDFPENVDLWIPAPSGFQNLDRTSTFLTIVGRLAPNSSIAQARAELATINDRLARDYPATDANIEIALRPLQEVEVQDARVPLLALFGAVAAVLLVACVNIAGLMLSRAWGRQRESSVRVALGAGAGRLIRLRLVEVCWIAALGGVFGLALAFNAITALKRFLPPDLPRLNAIELDSRVVLFAALTSILSAILAGVLPAWMEARGTLALGLKQGSNGSLGDGRRLLRSGLIIGQIALSMTLLVCAALLGRSLLELQRAHLGFSGENTISMTTSFSWNDPGSKIKNFSNGVLTRLKGLPGVTEAGIVDRLPLSGGAQSAPVVVRGRALAGDLATQTVSFRTASAGYFRALSIPLIEGSLFPETPDAKGPKVVIVNERFRRRFFPQGSAIGQYVQMRSAGKPPKEQDWARIIGVTGNVRANLRENNPYPEIYRAWGQDDWPLLAFVVRSTVPPESLASSLRKVAAEVDPDQVVQELRPLTSLLAQSTAGPRTQAGLVTAFAASALLLAAVGLYGLLLAEVNRRTQEFGVRLALGASPRVLLQDALTRGMILVAAGLVLGGIGALAASRFLRTLLYNVTANDAGAAALAAAVLIMVGLAASWLPARRASMTAPLHALRRE